MAAPLDRILIRIDIPEEDLVDLRRWQDGYDRALRSVLDRCEELLASDPCYPLAALAGELEDAVDNCPPPDPSDNCGCCGKPLGYGCPSTLCAPCELFFEPTPECEFDHPTCDCLGASRRAKAKGLLYMGHCLAFAASS